MNFTDSLVSPFCIYIFQDENKNSFNNIYQYYMFKKFGKIYTFNQPNLLLLMSNSRREQIVSNWSEIRYNVMKDGYLLCMKKNTQLKEILILEQTYTDTVPVELTFWKKNFYILLQELTNTINNKEAKQSLSTLPINNPTIELKVYEKTKKIIFNDDDNIIF